MKVSTVILRTSDLDRAVGFWSEKVGLTLLGRHEAFAFLDGGTMQLALNAVDNPIEDRSMTEVVLEVDDVSATYREMADRGVPFEIEPRVVTSDGTRNLLAAHFYDPDGHGASITGWVET
ncbi:MAG TPA: VOC family protein [Acidimicrobiia bacterium]|nr:VOC family protein [Acidimicrobiia bacterium]